ncbi:LysR family transcriptional regulator [Streptomyces sp. NPDC048409]|uniref:LysR family transcriptional regulator n=1 Tax=Streptomyces sp. NPDC048409 TaxID=3154723 RepID=UPI003423D313
MELRSLQLFVAVAEESSFTKAAERCRVSQPTISHHIQSLEKEIGEQLFDRDRRNVALSDGGHTLLPYARTCIASAQAAKDAFASRSRTLMGRLAIGTVEGVEDGPLPKVLQRLHALHPAVRVRLQTGTTAPLIDDVAQGRLDAAITARPLGDLPHGLRSKIVLTDQIVALLRPENVPENGRFPLRSLTEERLITYDETSGLHPIIGRALSRAGQRLRAAFSTNDVPLQVRLAEAGVGVALSAGSDPAVLNARNVVTCRLDPPIPYQKLLVWRAKDSPTAPLEAFIDLWELLGKDGRWDSGTPSTEFG